MRANVKKGEWKLQFGLLKTKTYLRRYRLGDGESIIEESAHGILFRDKEKDREKKHD